MDKLCNEMFVQVVDDCFKEKYDDWAEELYDHTGFYEGSFKEGSRFLCHGEKDPMKVLACVVEKCRAGIDGWKGKHAYIHCLSRETYVTFDSSNKDKRLWKEIFQHAKCLALTDEYNDDGVHMEFDFSFLTFLDGKYYVVVLKETRYPDDDLSYVKLDLFQLQSDDFVESVILGWQGQKPQTFDGMTKLDEYLENIENVIQRQDTVMKCKQLAAAIVIQRAFRGFLERPVYPSGKCGYHARKGWESCQQEMKKLSLHPTVSSA